MIDNDDSTQQHYMYGTGLLITVIFNICSIIPDVLKCLLKMDAALQILLHGFQLGAAAMAMAVGYMALKERIKNEKNGKEH